MAAIVFVMETTQVEPHCRLEGRAEGELQGTGCWTFAAADGITTVRYDWNIQTTQAWMNLLAPLARRQAAWDRLAQDLDRPCWKA